MKVVIIEDEMLTAESLADIIVLVNPQAQVQVILQSVADAIQYFKNNAFPDLIFSDIQLGDGLCFDIFSTVDIQVPIIFCTAFDEYAIKAFNANGIHYVLKPFDAEKIREAFDKYEGLRSTFSNWSESLENIIDTMGQDKKKSIKKSSSVLVYFKDSIIPIKLEDIALFYKAHEATNLYTFDGKTYVVNQSLNDLQQLDTQQFFRANRQIIINRNAVKEASSYLSRKISISLNIPFKESVIVSKEKIPTFLKWLRGEEED